MNLQRLKQDWEELAAIDPLWAVLIDRRYKDSRWPVREFFERGEAEIADVLRTATGLGAPVGRARALDFGCGVGRVTRAMSAHFQTCIGVDISEGMVDRAKELNADRTNCQFVVNTRPDLQSFEANSFDFVYSTLVLQHMPSRSIALGYLGEFLRVLRRDGLLVFQVPYYLPWLNRLQLRRHLYEFLRGLGVSGRLLHGSASLHPMRSIAIPERDVRKVIGAHRGVVAFAEPDNGLGRGLRYYVRLAQ